MRVAIRLDGRKKKLRKAWNQHQEANKLRYRELLKEYKQAQEDLKEETKGKFFEEAESIPSYARIHKLLAKDKTTISLLKPDGTFTRDGKETAEHLLKTHFPGSAGLQDGENRVTVSSDPEPSRRDWAFADRLTKRSKVKLAVFKFFSFKSAGLDGVFPALLKEGIDLLLDRLRSIFKSSIALSIYPGFGKRSEWRIIIYIQVRPKNVLFVFSSSERLKDFLKPDSAYKNLSPNYISEIRRPDK